MPSTEEELDRKTFLYNLLVPVMNKYVCVCQSIVLSRV
jgi:auxin responsive GH3 gene family